MIRKSIELLHEALELPEDERVRLALQILDSLEAPDENAEAEWDLEIDRRLADMASGKAKTVPWTEIRKRLRAPVDDSPAS